MVLAQLECFQAGLVTAHTQMAGSGSETGFLELARHAQSFLETKEEKSLGKHFAKSARQLEEIVYSKLDIPHEDENAHGVEFHSRNRQKKYDHKTKEVVSLLERMADVAELKLEDLKADNESSDAHIKHVASFIPRARQTAKFRISQLEMRGKVNPELASKVVFGNRASLRGCYMITLSEPYVAPAHGEVLQSGLTTSATPVIAVWFMPRLAPSLNTKKWSIYCSAVIPENEDTSDNSIDPEARVHSDGSGNDGPGKDLYWFPTQRFEDMIEEDMKPQFPYLVRPYRWMHTLDSASTLPTLYNAVSDRDVYHESGMVEVCAEHGKSASGQPEYLNCDAKEKVYVPEEDMQLISHLKPEQGPCVPGQRVVFTGTFADEEMQQVMIPKGTTGIVQGVGEWVGKDEATNLTTDKPCSRHDECPSGYCHAPEDLTSTDNGKCAMFNGNGYSCKVTALSTRALQTKVYTVPNTYLSIQYMDCSAANPCLAVLLSRKKYPIMRTAARKETPVTGASSLLQIGREKKKEDTGAADGAADAGAADGAAATSEDGAASGDGDSGGPETGDPNTSTDAAADPNASFEAYEQRKVFLLPGGTGVSNCVQAQKLMNAKAAKLPAGTATVSERVYKDFTSIKDCEFIHNSIPAANRLNSIEGMEFDMRAPSNFVPQYKTLGTVGGTPYGCIKPAKGTSPTVKWHGKKLYTAADRVAGFGLASEAGDPAEPVYCDFLNY